MSSSPKNLDVVTIGRASIDLYGAEIGVDLPEATLFRRSVGGSPTNIAIGASRLGLRASLLTRVGDDQMGLAILQCLKNEGVDCSAIKADPQRLTALVLLAVQDHKHAPHLFYRSDCADMSLCESDVTQCLIARTRSIVLTGTHFSTATVSAASWRAIKLAKKHGARVIFDIDFRPSLWGLTSHSEGAQRTGLSSAVTKAFSKVITASDLVVGTEEEICAATGREEVAEALSQIRSQSDAIVVCKRGAYGCDVYLAGTDNVGARPVQGQQFSVDVVNTIGAGDAFMAGFLRGYLNDEPLQTCATYANANGAIAVTRLLCSQDYAHWPELKKFIAPDETSDPERSKTPMKNFFLLACDHRSQFRDITDDLGTDHSRFGAFKQLAVKAAQDVGQHIPNTGVIIDDEYGTDALFDAGRNGVTAARPVEVPGSRPLEFVTGKDVGSALIEWPRDQIVKCLCHYDPSDEPALLRTQQDRILQVFEACQRTGHAFLLEIIPPAKAGNRIEAVTRALAQIYALGVKPTYWKLEPFVDTHNWNRINEIVEQEDPDCRGIVMLGQANTTEQLADALRATAEAPLVIGFAIGRAIVAEPFQAWIEGKIDDDSAVAQMSKKFRNFIEVWNESRPDTAQQTVGS
ncbi:5-dehydro-2-deoxygluconokinase [Shimia sp.]|uniref:5-dehydro-2-deoxygluconokinase n=1 Tax=Shimia sp. TaxID=1954381 RepID=UPI0032982636